MWNVTRDPNRIVWLCSTRTIRVHVQNVLSLNFIMFIQRQYERWKMKYIEGYYIFREKWKRRRQAFNGWWLMHIAFWVIEQEIEMAMPVCGPVIVVNLVLSRCIEIIVIDSVFGNPSYVFVIIDMSDRAQSDGIIHIWICDRGDVVSKAIYSNTNPDNYVMHYVEVVSNYVK